MNKKQKSSHHKNLVLVFCLFLVGALCGFYFGSQTGKASSSVDLDNNADKKRASKIDMTGAASTGSLSGLPDNPTDIGKMIHIALSENFPQKRNYLIQHFLHNLSAENIPLVLKAIEQDSNFRIHEEFVTLFFQRWAEIDPIAALVYAQKEPPVFNTYYANVATNSTLIKWSMINFNATVDWINRNLQGYKKENALGSLLNDVKKENLKEVTSMIQREKIPVTEWNYGNIWKLLVEESPQKAIAFAQSLSNPTEQKSALIRIAQLWSKKEPEEALKLLDQVDGNEASGIRHYIISKWANEDLESALKFVDKQPEGKEKKKLLFSVAMIMADSDPKNALRMVEENKLDESNEYIVFSILSKWTSSDPEAVAEYILKIDKKKQSDYVSHYLRSRFEENLNSFDETLKASLAFLSKLEERSRSSALGMIAHYWSLNDPQSAAEYARTLTGKEQEHLLATVCSSWAGKNIEELLEWQESLTDAAFQSKVISKIITGLAKSNPARAASFLSKLNGNLQIDTVKNLASSWSFKDPKGAAKWAAGLSEKMQPAAFSAIVKQWSIEDAPGASAWLKSLPAGSARDGAIQTFVDHISNTDVSAAVLWAESISDVNLRENTVTGVVENWLIVEPERAKEWIIETSTLSEKQKEQFLGEETVSFQF